MNYILGLDIGIGSVGWAIVRNDDNKRIEDFGVRIFESGEIQNGKNRLSQERRGFRSARRLVRRRSHRKTRLKRHLEQIGLIRVSDINLYYERYTPNPLYLREKGLTAKLLPEELAAALIHICNHRGYQDFYEMDEVQIEMMNDSERKEYLAERVGIDKVNRLMTQGGYPSVAAMLLHDPAFCSANSPFPDYRNHAYKTERYPIARLLLRKEADHILATQSEWYDCLTDDAQQKIRLILFQQRDFEDGPGDPQDPWRKYTGFLDQLGECPFYHEARGFRFTVLADVYALINVLSQYRFAVLSTGESVLLAATAQALVEFALREGNIVQKDVKAIAKEHGQSVNMKPAGEKIEPITQCMKYCRMMKPVLEGNGFNWALLIGDGPLCKDENTMLYRIGEILSKYQTPRRRLKKLMEIEDVSDELARIIAQRKTSGTVKVCPRYMRDAIEAFLNGDIYGNFQSTLIKKQDALPEGGRNGHRILPPFEKDAEFVQNPVVFRSINETRKLINAVINRYGSPAAINIEVASEVGRSYDDRMEMMHNQAENERATATARTAIAGLLSCEVGDVNASMVERYKLGESQNWKCLYCGEPLDMRQALQPNDRNYEVDHIIPFSLILDNTLHNKALVCHACNQHKGQRTPLMFLGESKKKDFLARVNTAFSQEKISKKKLQYLQQADLREDKLDDWKSRNINDTRYISKYLVRYLSDNLAFSSSAAKPVFAVKGAITSRFRRQWLNKETWGTDDKDQKRKETHLHHAVDAVVIANCTPAYVELASDNMKLYQMFKRANQIETDEYREYLKKSVEKMEKYYYMDGRQAENLLRYQKKAPTLIPRLREEVEVRFNDEDSTLYRERLFEFYRDDPAFAISIRDPLVSYKPDRKAVGKITDANAVSLRMVNGALRKITRKDVLTLTEKDLERLHTNDPDLWDSLQEAFSLVPADKTLGEWLRKENREVFVTKNGKEVHKVTLLDPAPQAYLKKQMSRGNHSILSDSSYYCVEVYKDGAGKTHLRGIRYSDLRRENKKLYIAADVPEGYQSHVMYLFPNDYIVVKKSDGTIKFEGYYKSVANINQNHLNYAKGCVPQQRGKVLHIASGDQFEKYDIDLLGRIGGKIKCSEPLSLRRVKE